MAEDSDGNGLTQDTVNANTLNVGGEKARQMVSSVREL